MDISSEKTATGWNRRAATFHAIFIANPVLPMLGRAAKTIRLPAWRPAVSLSRSMNPVLTPTVETMMHQGWDHLHRRWIASEGLQRWKYAYTSYDLTDYASDTPTVTLAYLTNPTSSSYTNLSYTLASTTTKTWARRQISTGNRANSIGFKTTQTNPGDLKLYALGLVYDPLDIGKVG